MWKTHDWIKMPIIYLTPEQYLKNKLHFFTLIGSLSICQTTTKKEKHNTTNKKYWFAIVYKRFIFNLCFHNITHCKLHWQKTSNRIKTMSIFYNIKFNGPKINWNLFGIIGYWSGIINQWFKPMFNTIWYFLDTFLNSL